MAGNDPLNLVGNDPLNLAGEIYFCTPLGIDFHSNLLGVNLLDSCGDKPLNSVGNDPLNSAREIYFCTPLGINFQSLLGMILPIPLGKLFQTALPKDKSPLSQNL